jgi:hypothetical protein
LPAGPARTERDVGSPSSNRDDDNGTT